MPPFVKSPTVFPGNRLRRFSDAICVALLAILWACLPVTAWSAHPLGWMTREEVLTLPEDLQIPVPSWCGGVYYHPDLQPTMEPGNTIVSADESTYVPEGITALSGSVVIEQPGRRITANSATFDQHSGNFSASGDIQAQTPEMAVIADAMSGNTGVQEATLTKVRFSLFQAQGHGKASSVAVEGEKVHIRKGTYTTCAPGQKGWQLNTSHMDIDREKGWGSARNVVLRIHDMPVLYVPWVTFPVDDRRKSGLLFPELSTTDSGGLDVTLPVYANLHPQADATISIRHLYDRGSGLDNEFRYLTPLGKGALNYALLRNDQQFDALDRESARWLHHGEQGNWILDSDVNYVSDDFYLKDLSSGLDQRATTQLARLGQVRYLGSHWDFLARVQAWQTIDPSLPNEDLPYRRLPQLMLSGTPGLPGPMTLEWVSEFSRFDRSDREGSDNITGDRLHFQPAISMPMTSSWGYFVPRVRVYHTQYRLDGAATSTDDQPSRTLTGANLDAGLLFDRSLTILGQAYTQTLEPRLFYNHVQHRDQTELPDFDSGELTLYYSTLFRENRFSGFDRIGDEEKLALGVTSRVQVPQTGRELLRARAAIAHYLEDRETNLSGDFPDERRRSPVVTDINLHLDDQWQFFAETQWDSERDKRDQNSARLSYSNTDGYMLYLGYRYRPVTGIEQLEVAGAWPLHHRLEVIGRSLRDLEGKRTLENLIGIQYRDCCWKVRLIGLRELYDRTGDTTLESEETLMLQIQMVGLGGLGGEAESLLRRSIPGYRD